MLRVLVMGLCLPMCGCGSSGLNQSGPPEGDVSADLAGTAVSDLSDVADLAAPPDLTDAPDLAPTPTCSDHQKNGTETDVDCGGNCAPCGLSKGCVTAADCTTGLCVNGVCTKRVPVLSFGTPILYAGDKQPTLVVSGDFNNDGIADLATANNNYYDYAVFLGRGDGTLAAPLVTSLYRFGALTRASAFALVSGDFNSDGASDLATLWMDSDSSYNETTEITIVFSDGTGNLSGGRESFFQCQTYPPTSCRPVTALAVKDINRDRADDFVVNTGDATGLFSMLQGSGGQYGMLGPFANSEGSTSTGTSTRTLLLEDVNGDHNVDAIVLDTSFPSPYTTSVGAVDVLLGDGVGAFGPPLRSDVNSGSNYYTAHIASGDFDGDGFADIVAVDKYVVVLHGNGDGTFGAKRIYAAGGSVNAVATADFNLDGNVDIVMANGDTGTVTILLGKGDGTFPVSSNFVAGVGAGSVAVSDLNGDGLPDIAVADGQNLVLLMNTSH